MRHNEPGGLRAVLVGKETDLRDATLSKQSNHRIFVVAGLVLSCLFYDDVLNLGGESSADPIPEIIEAAYAAPSLPTLPVKAPRLYEEDPLAYLKFARRDYDNRVRDYVCRFTKQELLGGRLTAEQVAEAKFREGPFSVYMHITKNAQRARRLLFVQDRIVKGGKQHLTVQPEGPIARLLVNSVERPVDGKDARRAARKPITLFGFAHSLDLLIKYAEIAKDRGRLDVRYIGEGEIGGRPTYVIERWLPIDDSSYPWPDARVVIHMDQEWNLPLACYSYADYEGKELLGKYTYTNVHLNVGLQDKDFDPKTYGL